MIFICAGDEKSKIGEGTECTNGTNEVKYFVVGRIGYLSFLGVLKTSVPSSAKFYGFLVIFYSMYLTKSNSFSFYLKLIYVNMICIYIFIYTRCG